MCHEPKPQDKEVQKLSATYTGSLLFYPGLHLHKQPAQPEPSSTAKESHSRPDSHVTCVLGIVLSHSLV